MRIPNHYSARLSPVDLTMVRSVPPGGNWKDIPTDIPSKRLEQIRVSYRNGEGSRSTYYGRLHPDRPAYTITTYFNRPGNGCNIHYDTAGGQHRVISEREAARLQSFPDVFEFLGAHTSIAKQIGNAVPPLLSFQIAKTFGGPGLYVDLYSGAGGLALGFDWAGWTCVIANDIEASFLETYRRNLQCDVASGDSRRPEVFSKIVQTACNARKQNPSLPLVVLGGPPCQGYSTAGNRRSRSDERNSLYKNYTGLVQAIDPDLFMFENVPGLLNMERGAVFEEVKSALQAATREIRVWKLRADAFGVPQRRRRVFLVGIRHRFQDVAPPVQKCEIAYAPLFEGLHPPICVKDALDDLPPLMPGEDASTKGYLAAPRTPYQELMRGVIGPEEYLRTLSCPARESVAGRVSIGHTKNWA